MSAYNTDQAPLLGFLTDESDAEVRIEVTHGTWIIQRSDVESMSDWDNPADVELDGRPVQVIAKPGAALGFLQTVKLEATERPMTISEQGSELFGADELERMSQAWGGQFDFAMDVKMLEGSPSASCWESPGGWGMTCKADDCQD